MRIATFNVNGIRARLPIVLQWLKDQEPHVLCMQEIKSQEKDFPLAAFQEAGYVVSLRGQKSFNGVAIACRAQPEEIPMKRLHELLPIQMFFRPHSTWS